MAALKLLHVVPSFWPAHYFGGPIVSLYALCNHLAAFPEIDLQVLTTDTSGLGSKDRLDERALKEHDSELYKVHYCRKIAGSDLSLELISCLKGYIAWADVVHVTSVYSVSTPIALALARLARKPVVWSPRGALQRWSQSRMAFGKRFWDRGCDFLLHRTQSIIHATSEQEAVESSERIHNARAVVVGNGVEVPQSLPSRVWRPNGKFRLLYLGRIDPKKGVENLLQAIAELRDDSITLQICGSGGSQYVGDLMSASLKLGLASQVTFSGTVLGPAKLAAFMEADICVVPSHTENFGMVVAESLAHGVPVIASQNTPWSEIEMKGAGYWVANNPLKLKQTILHARTAELEAMGQAGRKWMGDSYGWDQVARRMLRVYREISGMRAPVT